MFSGPQAPLGDYLLSQIFATCANVVRGGVGIRKGEETETQHVIFAIVWGCAGNSRRHLHHHPTKSSPPSAIVWTSAGATFNQELPHLVPAAARGRR